MLGSRCALRKARSGQTIVTASEDKTARMWDASTGQELRQLQGHTNAIWSAAYGRDGKTIVTTSDE
jgi:WD40 repeat protein